MNLKYTLIVKVLLLSLVKSKKYAEVMKSLSIRFGWQLLECNGLVNADLWNQFLDFWDPRKELKNPKLGCAALCAVYKLKLLSDEGLVKQDKVKELLEANEADNHMVTTLFKIYSACRRVVTNNHYHGVCKISLEFSGCLRQGVIDHGWVPNIEELRDYSRQFHRFAEVYSKSLSSGKYDRRNNMHKLTAMVFKLYNNRGNMIIYKTNNKSLNTSLIRIGLANISNSNPTTKAMNLVTNSRKMTTSSKDYYLNITDKTSTVHEQALSTQKLEKSFLKVQTTTLGEPVVLNKTEMTLKITTASENNKSSTAITNKTQSDNKRLNHYRKTTIILNTFKNATGNNVKSIDNESIVNIPNIAFNESRGADIEWPDLSKLSEDSKTTTQLQN